MSDERNPASVSDGDLIELYFNRDERAVSETRRKYGTLFRSIAMRLLDDPFDAEECENDVYWHLWTSIPPARPDNFAAYGSKTARNIALSRLEKDRALKRGGHMLAAELSDALPDPSDDYALSELTGSIDSFLRTLERSERILFLLRYFHGYSVAELAKSFGCSSEAVKSRLFRTRQKLKAHLERGGYAL